jgi:hypothetical protein
MSLTRSCAAAAAARVEHANALQAFRDQISREAA